MRVTTLLMFGAGYVLGTRAGRERYAALVTVAERASKRLEDYSARHGAGNDEPARGSGRRKAAL